MPNNRLIAPAERVPGMQRTEDSLGGKISVKTLDGGMNTKTDLADLEDNEFSVAQNVTIRSNKISRRIGTSLLTPTKPDSQAIAKMYTAKLYSGTIFQLRFAATSIYKRAVGAWNEIEEVATPITAPANNVVSTDNRHFFSNRGVNLIQEIDLGAETYDALGNAPKYKYITAFYNRIIGANLVAGSNIPNQVGWSGDFNYGEWDPAVDLSAGFAPLEESQSDYADEIVGIFGFANSMIIPREQSIWVANKIPGNNPFFFYTAVPSIGCTVPNSIQKIPNGIVFYDRRTNSVYVFDTVNGLTVIGRKVEDSIYASIGDPDDVFSAFEPVEQEYKLCCPLTGTNTVRCWTYSFKNGTWWYDEYESITSADTVNFEEPSVLINDLTGSIEDLLGDIQDLGPDEIPTPNLWFGKSDGDVLIQNGSINTGYETIISSKIWTADSDVDTYFQRLVFTYVILAEGSYTIEYSKDGQVNWIAHKTVNILNADYGKRMRVVCAKSIKARQFSWRVRSSAGIFELVDFKATVTPGGYSTP